MYRFGRLLSTIVSQNVVILIAIGLIRALFGVYGWFPNDNVNLMVGPFLNWLVPALFGYTGGYLLGGRRGGTVAAIVVFGLALASNVSMIFIAVLIGPVIGYMVNRIERVIENRLPSGYELLTANFIFAVLACGLAVVNFLYVGQFLSSILNKINEWILHVAYSGWLPALAAFIEPAKVMFLNNVMAYGILGPIGISQIRQLSKSIFFLLESNPGPAIGMLLAYIIRLRGQVRRNAVSSLAIHALGGIQEVYFPYVLMKPQLLLALVLGNMSGIWIFQYWNAGLASIPSPPSLFLVIGLAPPGDVFYVTAGIGVSAVVSMAVSLAVFGSAKEIDERKMGSREHALIRRLEHVEQWEEVSPMLRRSPNIDQQDSAEPDMPAAAALAGDRKLTVCFACDAGLGSSAMGAAILRKKLRSVQLDGSVIVVHSSLDEIPREADLIVTHHYLLNRAKKNAPGRAYMSIGNYTDPAAYESILQKIRAIAQARV